MDAEVQLYLDDLKERMDKAITHLVDELIKVRAGKANPGMLNGIMVDYYGAPTPIQQVSSISTTDARTIVIQPWEKKVITLIEKAILASNIGLTPMNNGELIRLVMPPVTEQRRKELVKQVKNEGEQAKVAVRNIRREIMEEIKKLKKNGLSEDEEKTAEEEIQKFTDGFIKKVDEQVAKKEEEIMTV